MTILFWLVFFCLITFGNGDNSENIEEGDLSIDDSPELSQSTSSPGGSEDCTSKHSLCDFWAKSGECSTSRKFMSEYCSGSCKTECKGKTRVNDDSVECNNYIQYCQFWASQGECEKNPTYMIWQCPKECHPKCGGKSGSSSNGTDSKKGPGSNAPQVKLTIKKVGGSQNDKKNSNGTAAVERNSESDENFIGDKIVLPRRRIRPEKELKSVRTISKSKSQKITRIPKVLKTASTSSTLVTESAPKVSNSVSKRTTRRQSSVSKNKPAFTVQSAVTPKAGFSPLVPVHINFTDEQLETKASNKAKSSKQAVSRVARIKTKGYKLRHRFVQQQSNDDEPKRKSNSLQVEDAERPHLLKEKE